MTGPSAAQLEDLYERYAIKFDLDWNMDGNTATSDEPTDENLKAVLDHCVRPARPGEYAAIRRHVLANRAAAKTEEEVMIPIDPELFERTAPAWNCVGYPGDGMHYTPGPNGRCVWCGASREKIAAERRARDAGLERAVKAAEEEGTS